MKYKVILYVDTNAGGNPDSAVTFSFYTKSQAELVCDSWRSDKSQVALLWDGSTWQTYAPIP